MQSAHDAWINSDYVDLLEGSQISGDSVRIKSFSTELAGHISARRNATITSDVLINHAPSRFVDAAEEIKLHVRLFTNHGQIHVPKLIFLPGAFIKNNGFIDSKIALEPSQGIYFETPYSFKNDGTSEVIVVNKYY